MNKKSKIEKQFKTFKWILLFCSTIILISCSNTNERKELELNGNVKSCFERIYKAEQRFGKWENGDIKHYGHNRKTFDEKGQCQKIEFYDDDMDLDGKLLFVREKGKITEQAYYNGKGELENKTMYVYEKGEIIEQANYNGQEELEKKTMYVYEKGKVIEEIYYDSDDKLIRKSILKHMSKNELDYESFDPDGKKTAYGKNISKDGKMIKRTYTTIKDGVDDEIYTTIFEYDKNGNQVLEKTTNKKGEIHYYQRFEYLEFDAKKNWTRKLIYAEDDEPEKILIREIEYY